jgi:uncharacterized delta-60 repeat protein
VAVVALDAGPATAWPGDPDGAWGSCGIKSIVMSPDFDSEATSVLPGPDGGYLIGGRVGPKALVAKLLADGSPAPTFGSGGSATASPGTDATFAAIALQSDGKIVAAGSRTASDDSVDSLVVRFTAAGLPDPSFSTTGTLTDNFGGTDRLAAVRVQANGAILVGGSTGDDGFVARVTSTGLPDNSFDADGERTGLPLTVDALILQPDGKIVIGGRSASNDFAVMRLNANGSTDATFGGSSGVADDLGGYDFVTGLALDGDGKVVAAGAGHGAKGSGHTIVRRYDTAGAPDPAFHAIDKAFGLDDRPVAVTVRADGKIVLTAGSKVGSDNDVLLLRLNADGIRDDTFGIGGIALHDAGMAPVVGDAVVRMNGRVVVAGSARASGRRQVALIGYQSDTSTAPTPTQGFVLDARGGLSGFYAGCSARPGKAAGNTKWPGEDVARGVAVLTGGRGLVLENTGALHPFRFGDGSVSGLTVSGNAIWKSDMARGVAVVPEGTGGFVVDKYGVLHPFKVGAGPKPAMPIPAAVRWPNDYARGVALLPNGVGGYVLDATGGLHAFGGAPKSTRYGPAWPGQDRARGVAIAPDGSGGWIVDSLGAIYPFGIGANAKPVAAAGAPKWTTPTARGVAALP